MLEGAVAAQEKIEAAQKGVVCNLNDVLGYREKEPAAIVLYTAGAILANWLPILALVLYAMRMRRSFCVVSKRMTGGCTMGTSAMYEYAATVMAPI